MILFRLEVLGSEALAVVTLPGGAGEALDWLATALPAAGNAGGGKGGIAALASWAESTAVVPESAIRAVAPPAKARIDKAWAALEVSAKSAKCDQTAALAVLGPILTAVAVRWRTLPAAEACCLLLVKEEDLRKASAALQRAGHEVGPAARLDVQVESEDEFSTSSSSSEEAKPAQVPAVPVAPQPVVAPAAPVVVATKPVVMAPAAGASRSRSSSSSSKRKKTKASRRSKERRSRSRRRSRQRRRSSTNANTEAKAYPYHQAYPPMPCQPCKAGPPPPVPVRGPCPMGPVVPQVAPHVAPVPVPHVAHPMPPHPYPYPYAPHPHPPPGHPYAPHFPAVHPYAPPPWDPRHVPMPRPAPPKALAIDPAAAKGAKTLPPKAGRKEGKEGIGSAWGEPAAGESKRESSSSSPSWGKETPHRKRLLAGPFHRTNGWALSKKVRDRQAVSFSCWKNGCAVSNIASPNCSKEPFQKVGVRRMYEQGLANEDLLWHVTRNHGREIELSVPQVPNPLWIECDSAAGDSGKLLDIFLLL